MLVYKGFNAPQMTYQSCCHCKLTIISVILSGIATFIQILLIYLEQMDKIKNTIWFQLIVAVLNASLGCVNCVQLGIRRNQRIEAEKNDLSVEVEGP